LTLASTRIGVRVPMALRRALRLRTVIARAPSVPRSLAPKILEPRWIQFGVPHRMLDILVTQVSLQAGVVPPVRVVLGMESPQLTTTSLEAFVSQVASATRPALLQERRPTSRLSSGWH
jgi:hypothetical protein